MVGQLELNESQVWELVDKHGNRIAIPVGAEIELFNYWQWVTTRLVKPKGELVAEDGSELFTGKWARYLGLPPVL